MVNNTTDILIVGAGPVGLTGALIAHELGLSVRIVERRPTAQSAPAAHVINARTFEIWRQIGLDVEKIRSSAQSPDKAGLVHWVTRLGEKVLGTLQYEQQGDDNLSVTPTPLRNLSQHLLEPLLVSELKNRGIDVEYASTWGSFSESSDGITSTVSKDGQSEDISSKWLIACDGASSSVRNACGISMVGPDNLQKFFTVHFKADLNSLTASNPGILYWICDPRAGGTLISHGGDNEWVYMYPIAEDDEAQMSPSECDQLIRNAIVPTSATITVLRQSSWTMTSQIADSYRLKCVLLAGDAAHRFPPSGGMGLNTGVGDIHNLMWKINRIEEGFADASLLDTYDKERRPIAERNAQASMDNAFKMFDVFMALGIDPDKEIAYSNLNKVLQDSEALEVLDRAIENQATHFDMLGLQIGYRYILPASTTDLEPLTDEIIRNYRPSIEAGNRLPHGWIEQNGEKISSLDLVSLDEYSIIGGSGFVSELPHFKIGRDFQDTENWWSQILGLSSKEGLLVRPDQHIELRLSSI
jgi:2-polyprenyl-6-methoxyphenol hydroxylase-like FAD-dependent oxidoreductase